MSRCVEAGLDHLAPAALEEVRQGLDPADDQPVAGPGQRHVEQTQRLVVAGPLALGAGGGGGGAVVDLARRPEEAAALALQQRRRPDGGAGGGVGQDHHRRLQALGAVRGHHPHLAVALPLRVLLLALHLDLAGGHLGDEPLQLDDAAPLGRQRLGEVGVDRVLRLAARAGSGSAASSTGRARRAAPAPGRRSRTARAPRPRAAPRRGTAPPRPTPAARRRGPAARVHSGRPRSWARS